jgi:hypothetical protein
MIIMMGMDHPSVHGMLVVGEEIVYLSHLPMFHHPHDYQVILEVTFTNGNGDPQAVYVEDRRQTQTSVYTLRPEAFSLPGLVSTDPAHPALRSFKGTVYQGHFERGGTPILKDVVVNVTNVVHFRQFKPDEQLPRQLAYFFFGKGQELFMAHLIAEKPPDFDQVLAVKSVSQDSVSQEFTDEELRQGVLVVFPGRANKPENRLREGERLREGILQVDAGGNDPGAVIEVEVGGEFYFEEGELSF